MTETVTTHIHAKRCTGCGLCVDLCPSDTLSLRKDKAVVTGQRCLACGQCAAVCPEQAVAVTALEADALAFATFDAPTGWIEYGAFSPGRLVGLLRSRRSCRKYQTREVGPSLLEDLVKIGITAPSGTNCQAWTFTLLPTRQEVSALGRQIGAFFERLNRKAEKWYLRRGLQWIGRGELDAYYRNHYARVKEALAEWENSGRDRLFHGAPAVIVVGADNNASTPAEDALLATQNILLGAHCLGLGTCLIGFAVAAMQSDPTIARFLGVPAHESVHAVIAVGYPAVDYQRPTGRKKVVPRYFKSPPG